MQTSTRVLRFAAPVLMIVLVSHSVPCGAQDVEQPPGPSPARTIPSPPAGRNSLFTPAGYAEFILPPKPVGLGVPVGVRFYGFWVGALNAPIVLFETPIQPAKFLTITPGFQYLRVPDEELGQMTTVPTVFRQSYVENQARIDATVKYVVGHLEIGERNMYVRRFVPAWSGADVNRYRNRLMLTQSVPVNGSVWKPYVSYEAFHDNHHRGWVRYRFWSGITLPFEKRVSFQPSFVHDDNRTKGIRDISYLMFALITVVQ
jgi:uncharacterized protein DUF2490